MNRTNWVAALVFASVVLVVVLVGCGLLWLLFAGFGRMMGPGITGPGGMMSGWCPWCGEAGPAGGGALAGLSVLCFIGLILFGSLGLLVLGVAWLARSTRTDEDSTASD